MNRNKQSLICVKKKNKLTKSGYTEFIIFFSYKLYKEVFVSPLCQVENM